MANLRERKRIQLLVNVILRSGQILGTNSQQAAISEAAYSQELKVSLATPRPHLHSLGNDK